jgi:uncharacterized protein (UPF0335 family)
MTKLAANSLEGKAQPYLERIERLLGEIDSVKSTAMNECKSLREDVRAIYGEAKDKGVPVKALKGLVKFRGYERKKAKIADGLDIDEAASYRQLVDALGELGAAAARAAGFDPPDQGRPDQGYLDQIGRG